MLYFAWKRASQSLRFSSSNLPRPVQRHSSSSLDCSLSFWHSNQVMRLYRCTDCIRQVDAAIHRGTKVSNREACMGSAA